VRVFIKKGSVLLAEEAKMNEGIYYLSYISEDTPYSVYPSKVFMGYTLILFKISRDVVNLGGKYRRVSDNSFRASILDWAFGRL
jgi:hypothetical protein